jgi:hypothetical protein
MVFKVNGSIIQENNVNDALVSRYREFEQYEWAAVPKVFLMRPL